MGGEGTGSDGGAGSGGTGGTSDFGGFTSRAAYQWKHRDEKEGWNERTKGAGCRCISVEMNG